MCTLYLKNNYIYIHIYIYIIYIYIYTYIFTYIFTYIYIIYTYKYIYILTYMYTYASENKHKWSNCFSHVLVRQAVQGKLQSACEGVWVWWGWWFVFLASNWGFPGMDGLFHGTSIYKWMRTGRTPILGNLQLYKIPLFYQCKPQMATSTVFNLILYLHMFFPWKNIM